MNCQHPLVFYNCMLGGQCCVLVPKCAHLLCTCVRARVFVVCVHADSAPGWLISCGGSLLMTQRLLCPRLALFVAHYQPRIRGHKLYGNTAAAKVPTYPGHLRPHLSCFLLAPRPTRHLQTPPKPPVMTPLALVLFLFLSAGLPAVRIYVCVFL